MTSISFQLIVNRRVLVPIDASIIQMELVGFSMILVEGLGNTPLFGLI